MNDNSKETDYGLKNKKLGLNSAVQTSGGSNWVDPYEAFKSSKQTREVLKKLWDEAPVHNPRKRKKAS